MKALEKAADELERINAWLLWICRFLVINLVAVLAVILACSVFWRYALDNAIAWSEEGSKYLMVWLTFLGAPIALRHGAHVNIDLLPKMLSARAQQAALLLVHLIIVTTMAILAYKGIGLAELGARQVASSFNLSMVWMYAAVPVGALFLLLVSLQQGLRAFIGILEPGRGLVLDETAWGEEIRE